MVYDEKKSFGEKFERFCQDYSSTIVTGISVAALVVLLRANSKYYKDCLELEKVKTLASTAGILAVVNGSVKSEESVNQALGFVSDSTMKTIRF